MFLKLFICFFNIISLFQLDCNSKNYISKSSFVATWSAAASLAHTLHFKLIAFEDLKSNAIVDIKQFETIGNDVFEKFAQRRNDQMTLDEFRVWAEDGNCEVGLFSLNNILIFIVFVSFSSFLVDWFSHIQFRKDFES